MLYFFITLIIRVICWVFEPVISLISIYRAFLLKFSILSFIRKICNTESATLISLSLRNTLVKLISQKESAEAFEAFKTNALNKYNFISAIEIADNTIEEK